MNLAIAVALIGAAATVLGAIAGPWVQWWLQVRSSQPLAGQEASRRWFLIFVGIVLVGAVATAVGVYYSITRFSGFANDFTPAWTSALQSNGHNEHYVGETTVPTNLEWHELSADGALVPSPAPQIDYTALGEYLYFRSQLYTKAYSWTGFFLWRDWGIPSLRLGDKSEIALILEAAEPDALEVGFKDRAGTEVKVALKVFKGWNGYRIPLARFLHLDANSIELFLVAHTRGVGSIDANTFRVAHVGTL